MTPDGLSATELGKIASSSGMTLDSFYKLLDALGDSGVDKGDISSLAPVLCQLKEFQTLRPFDSSEREQVLNEWIEGIPASK